MAPIPSEKQTNIDSSGDQLTSPSIPVFDELHKIRQELSVGNLLANNTNLLADSGDDLANKRADINRELTSIDNNIELSIPSLLGLASTALVGGRNEIRSAAETTRITTLRAGAPTIAATQELANLERDIRRRGKLKEAGAVMGAVAADYFIDNTVFHNQQSRAATYIADVVAPLFLGSQRWTLKIGGMILAHTVGKFIDSFNQPRYPFNPENTREQTTPEYLRDHPEATVTPSSTPTPTPVLHQGVDLYRNGTKKHDDEVRDRNRKRNQNGDPNNIYQ